jgi:hypothetical protein
VEKPERACWGCQTVSLFGPVYPRSCNLASRNS